MWHIVYRDTHSLSASPVPRNAYPRVIGHYYKLFRLTDISSRNGQEVVAVSTRRGHAQTSNDISCGRSSSCPPKSTLLAHMLHSEKYKLLPDSIDDQDGDEEALRLIPAESPTHLPIWLRWVLGVQTLVTVASLAGWLWAMQASHACSGPRNLYCTQLDFL